MDNGSIAKFINDNPNRAQIFAEDWKAAVKKHQIPAFQTEPEFKAWCRVNNLESIANLWLGNEVLRVLSSNRTPEPQIQQETQNQTGGPGIMGIASLALLPFIRRPREELLEDDDDFKKIEDDVKKKWLEDNPGKDFESLEGIDYLHGSLDDPDSPTAHDEAEKIFREKHKDKAEHYDKEAQRKYSNPNDDPKIKKTKQNIEEHIKTRKAYFEKNGSSENWDEVQKKIEKREWDRFAKRYSEKASAYRKNVQEIDNALDRQEIKQQLKERRERIGPQWETTGRDIRLTDKTKRPAPEMGGREKATERLESIIPVNPPHQLYIPSQRPMGAAGPRSEPRKNRGLIGGANKLPSLVNNAQNAGQGINEAVSALQKIKWFANPYFITFAGIFFLAVAIIMINGGGGSASFSGNGTGSTGGGGGTGNGGTISGNGCPDTSGNKTSTCRYLNPSVDIFDTNLSQDAINKYVNNYSGVFTGSGNDVSEFLKRTNYIIDNAKKAGLNPVLFLGYWKSESRFSTVGRRDMGCAGNGFYEEVDCALGINKFSDPQKNPVANCAKSKDANSPACKTLAGIRGSNGYDQKHPINYPIATFDDFAEAYGPYEDRSADGNPGNCTSTYNILVDMAKELGVCNMVTSGNNTASDCPIPNGTVTCGSLSSPVTIGGETCGHCDEAYKIKYGMTASCAQYPQTKYAIDIGGASLQEVKLPMVNGHKIKWFFNHEEAKSSIESLLGYGGEDTTDNTKYYLQLHHMAPGSNQPLNTIAYSGDIGGKICNGCSPGGSHVHVEIGSGATTLGNASWLDAPQFFCKTGQ